MLTVRMNLRASLVPFCPRNWQLRSELGELGWTWSTKKTHLLNPKNPDELVSFIFSYEGLSWVNWVMKSYELDFAGLAGFENNKGGF